MPLMLLKHLLLTPNMDVVFFYFSFLLLLSEVLTPSTESQPLQVSVSL